MKTSRPKFSLNPIVILGIPCPSRAYFSSQITRSFCFKISDPLLQKGLCRFPKNLLVTLEVEKNVPGMLTSGDSKSSFAIWGSSVNGFNSLAGFWINPPPGNSIFQESPSSSLEALLKNKIQFFYIRIFKIMSEFFPTLDLNWWTKRQTSLVPSFPLS